MANGRPLHATTNSLSPLIPSCDIVKTGGISAAIVSTFSVGVWFGFCELGGRGGPVCCAQQCKLWSGLISKDQIRVADTD